MTRRVVVTGMAGLCPLGADWESVKSKLLAKTSGVAVQPEWDHVDGLRTRLAAAVPDFNRLPHYPRKKVRTMGRVALMATRVTELALEAAQFQSVRVRALNGRRTSGDFIAIGERAADQA